VTTTEEFASALERAIGEKGSKLLHLKTDFEHITSATTIPKIRERAKTLRRLTHPFRASE
jgi:acetolactate synthase-1/2/3 large subunit